MVPSHQGSGRRGNGAYRGSSTRGQSLPGQNQQRQSGNMNLTYVREQGSSSLNYNDSSMQLDQASGFQVKITGFSELEDLDHLLRFLRSKAERPFQISCSTRSSVGKEVIITVPSERDANLLKQLSGIRYFGEKLLIQPLDAELAKRNDAYLPSRDISHSLASFVRAHVSADLQSASFDSTVGVLKSKFNIPFNFNQKHFIDKLLECIATIAPNVETLSFAKNSINSLGPFSQLWYLLPSIKNLNFEGNFIENLKELDCIVKITNLTELILSGNPVQRTPDYFKVMKGKFPMLRYLDRREIYRKGDSGKPARDNAHLSPSAFLGTVGNFFDSNESSRLVEYVFSKYFQLFDSDRSQLLELYNRAATFCITSIAFDSTLPQKLTPKRHGYRVGFFGPTDSMANASQKIQLGPADIMTFFSQMPQTQHDLTGMRFDAWQSVGTPVPLMNVFASGQFIDSSGFKRSFTRSFILVPAPSQTWTVSIISDVLTIVESCKLEHVSFSTESSEFSTKIDQLMQLTGLGRLYAQNCLAENDWDLQRSLQQVQTLKEHNRIPAEAFIR